MYWVGQKKNFTVSQQNVLKYVPIKLVFDGFQCDTQHHTRIWYFKYCRLLSNFLYVTLYLTPSWDCIKLSWAGGNPLPLIPSLPTSTLSFSIFYFSFFPFLLASSVLLLWHPFHSTRTVPLHFQAGCRRRQLNLALVFCVDFMLYVFLPRYVIVVYAVVVCPSVCPSVTRPCCIETAKCRITQTAPYRGPGTLVFWHQISRQNSNGGQSGAPNIGGVGSNGDFRPISCYISDMVQDRDIVTMER